MQTTKQQLQCYYQTQVTIGRTNNEASDKHLRTNTNTKIESKDRNTMQIKTSNIARNEMTDTETK